MNLTELAKYGPTGICIALVVTGAWMFREWLKYMKSQDARHEDIYKSFQKAIKENTKVTNETYLFMKSLNGSLKKAVEDKKTIAKKE